MRKKHYVNKESSAKTRLSLGFLKGNTNVRTAFDQKQRGGGGEKKETMRIKTRGSTRRFHGSWLQAEAKRHEGRGQPYKAGKKNERPATGKASPLFPCRGSDATMENNSAAVQKRKKRQDLPNINSISSHLNQRTTTN